MVSNKTWRTLHRWCGLLLAAFIIFYCLTGLLLNHRQACGYFVDKQAATVAVAATDMTGLRTVLDFYKQQLNRTDDPRVIRIPDNETIEFLYGSHGKTTYVIKPGAGSMEKIEKQTVEPFNRLNALHKVSKVSDYWLALADLFCGVMILLVVSGLVIMRYRLRDFVLLFSGVLLLLAGMVVA